MIFSMDHCEENTLPGIPAHGKSLALGGDNFRSRVKTGRSVCRAIYVSGYMVETSLILVPTAKIYCRPTIRKGGDA